MEPSDHVGSAEGGRPEIQFQPDNSGQAVKFRWPCPDIKSYSTRRWAWGSSRCSRSIISL